MGQLPLRGQLTQGAVIRITTQLTPPLCTLGWFANPCHKFESMSIHESRNSNNRRTNYTHKNNRNANYSNTSYSNINIKNTNTIIRNTNMQIIGIKKNTNFRNTEIQITEIANQKLQKNK